MKCDFCNTEAETTGAIIDGKYGQACRPCRSSRHRYENAQSAQWHRDRDREDNAADLVQPWVNNKPNPEFMRLYPEQSQDMFTEKELNEA